MEQKVINLNYPQNKSNGNSVLGKLIQDTLKDLGMAYNIINSSDILDISTNGSTLHFEGIRGGIYYLYNLLFSDNYNKLSKNIIKNIEKFASNKKFFDPNTTPELLEILKSGKQGNL